MIRSLNFCGKLSGENPEAYRARISQGRIPNGRLLGLEQKTLKSLTVTQDPEKPGKNGGR